MLLKCNFEKKAYIEYCLILKLTINICITFRMQFPTVHMYINDVGSFRKNNSEKNL